MARVCGGAGLLWEQYMIEEASSMTQAGISETPVITVPAQKRFNR